MIHLVHARNRALYGRELDQMFRMRAKFFKEILGWSALSVQDGLETDAYDDDRALYLLALESNGDVSVSVRLRPTDDRSLILDHFPHLLAESPSNVTRAGVWESCRYFAGPSARGPEGARRREELRLAMVEAARSQGIDRIVAITDTVFLPSLVQASWTTRLLGLASTYDEGECIALEIACTQEAHQMMQDRLAVHDPVLLDLWTGVFPPQSPPHEIERLILAQPIPPLELQELLAHLKPFSAQDLKVFVGVAHRLLELQSRQDVRTAETARGLLDQINGGRPIALH